MLPSPNQYVIQEDLTSFLTTILPTFEAIEGLDNNVSEPMQGDFIVMTPTMRERLGTNVEMWADCAFEATISGNTLTVSQMLLGAIDLSNSNQPPIWGVGVTDATPIIAQVSGTPGGAGVYTLGGAAQTVSTPTLMAAGEIILAAPFAITIQLDFHTSNVTDAADAAATFKNLFGTLQSTDAFRSYGHGVGLLYCDGPHLAPFQNAEQQWEQRWVINATFEAYQQVVWAQQFMTQVTIKLVQAGA